MIVVERAELRELLAARSVLVLDPELRYRKGCIYDVGIRRAALCRVIVIKIEGDSVRIQLVYQEQASMLASRSQYGYTDKPELALFGEPEAIGPHVLEGMTRDARERFVARRGRQASRMAAKPSSDRLEAIQRGTVVSTD